MNLEESFATVLKQNRIKNNYSQEKLAFESDLDRTFISLLERGQRQPTLSTIFRISNAMNINPEDLIKQVRELHIENSSKK